VYHSVFNDQPFIASMMLSALYMSKPLVIYCKSPHGKLLPQTGVHDTPEHVAKLERGHNRIIMAYEQFFNRWEPDCRYVWGRDTLPQPFSKVTDHVRNNS
jgi:hypothetical protein